MLEEREQRRVGPVQILEHEHRRPAPPRAPSQKRRQAVNDSSCDGRLAGAADQRRQPRPQPGPIRVVLRGSARSSFAAACSGESDSRMPHSAFTISPNAQNAIPSP